MFWSYLNRCFEHPSGLRFVWRQLLLYQLKMLDSQATGNTSCIPGHPPNSPIFSITPQFPLLWFALVMIKDLFSEASLDWSGMEKLSSRYGKSHPFWWQGRIRAAKSEACRIFFWWEPRRAGAITGDAKLHKQSIKQQSAVPNPRIITKSRTVFFMRCLSTVLCVHCVCDDLSCIWTSLGAVYYECLGPELWQALAHLESFVFCMGLFVVGG